MNQPKTCGSCRFCAADSRITDYRRRPMWFCRKKCTFFSRNYQPGEDGRVLPEQPACTEYEGDGTNFEEHESKETVLDESEL